jgi:8-oxo-dGTP pyrophosphatase MutT (NUDIX family)
MFIVNVEGAIFHKEKWLVIKRSTKEEHAGGTLSLVGGKVDIEGNALNILEETIKREIFEEVGIKIKDRMHFLYSSSFVLDDELNVINIVFLCEYSHGTAYKKSPDEVEDIYWMSFDEVVDHPNTPPWTKESMIKAEKQRNLLILSDGNGGRF